MNPDELHRENQTLRKRLFRLRQASRRSNESLVFGTALQEMADSARALTGGRYGALTSPDGSGRPLDFMAFPGKGNRTKAKAPAVSAGA